jgi:DNA polymerase V
LEDIWGIGSRLSSRLKDLNIYSAKDLRDSNPKRLRKPFGVVMERIIQELAGFPCLTLDSIQPRKQICSSQSFGIKITELSDLEEAISYYASIASVKLRKQDSLTSGIHVFLQTSLFNKNQPIYANSSTYSFLSPASDTRDIINAARKCMQQIYKKGYQYHKAGLMLLELIPNTIFQTDMFVDDGKNKKISF